MLGRLSFPRDPRLCTAALLVCALAMAGCSRRPRAPLLQDEPVYHNSREGIRFLKPEGWIQHAKADVPAGRTSEEHLLVDYIHWHGDMPALLELSLVDLPESTNLGAHAAQASFGAIFWKLVSGPEQVEAGGMSGKRYVLTSQEKRDRIKEVVAFRRGERVYFFIGVFMTADEAARDQIRQAMKSIVWE